MSECLYCPVCHLERTGEKQKRSFGTYCSKHLLETIREVKDKFEKNPALYREREKYFGTPDNLIELTNEIKRRYYKTFDPQSETS